MDGRAARYFDAAPREEINAFQTLLLRRLLTAALQNDWWRRWIGPAHSGLAFHELPIQRRAEVVAAYGIPPDVPAHWGAVEEGSTSGSSGVALRLRRTEVAGRISQSLTTEHLLLHGVALNEPRAAVRLSLPPSEGRHTVITGDGLVSPSLTYARRARQFSIEEHAAWLTDIPAMHLNTTPSVLDGVLDVFDGMQRRPRFKTAVMATETVTPKLRARTAELLGAKLIDRYTCEEIGPIALQCTVREDRYHVSITNAFVEVVDDRGRVLPEGASGSLVVTGLNSYAAFFIRYDLDDIGTLQRGCECGFAGPVIRDLLGRRRFLIQMPDGSRRAIGTPAKLWLSVAPFREQRLVQRRKGELTAEVVLDRPITDDERRRLAELLDAEIGGGLRCTVEQVERIDWTVTPKRQDVISLI